MSRSPAARWGIAEWYGQDLTAMTPEERKSAALIAIEQEDSNTPPAAPECPFLSTLVPGSPCNKIGGVCSIRKYEYGPEGSGIPCTSEKIVTTCPLRFLEKLDEDQSLFEWISHKMLDAPHPAIVKETPFLHTISEKGDEKGPSRGSTMAGRIDWIVVDKDSIDSQALKWCAIETQALYFSGNKMRHEFDAYAKRASPVLYPAQYRRPDYRSSGPKRLGPQLDVKVPVLRNWGNKVAVVIDRYFFESMNKLEDADPFAKSDAEHRDNADVVWFVLDYNEKLNLIPSKVVFTTLDSSRKALGGTAPLSKSEFTRNLKNLVLHGSKGNKVFSGINSGASHEDLLGFTTSGNED